MRSFRTAVLHFAVVSPRHPGHFTAQPQTGSSQKPFKKPKPLGGMADVPGKIERPAPEPVCRAQRNAREPGEPRGHSLAIPLSQHRFEVDYRFPARQGTPDCCARVDTACALGMFPNPRGSDGEWQRRRFLGHREDIQVPTWSAVAGHRRWGITGRHDESELTDSSEKPSSMEHEGSKP